MVLVATQKKKKSIKTSEEKLKVVSDRIDKKDK